MVSELGRLFAKHSGLTYDPVVHELCACGHDLHDRYGCTYYKCGCYKLEPLFELLVKDALDGSK